MEGDLPRFNDWSALIANSDGQDLTSGWMYGGCHPTDKKEMPSNDFFAYTLTPTGRVKWKDLSVSFIMLSSSRF